MKINFLLILLLIFQSTFADTKVIDPRKEKKILEIVRNILNKNHLVTKKIDNNFSKAVFKDYINSLDKFKLFFLESDIKEFKQYETKIDDQILKNDLTFFYLTYDRIMMRMREGKIMYTNALKSEIKFDKDEFYNDNSKNFIYQKTATQQNDWWRKSIKNYVFLEIDKLLKKQISEKVTTNEMQNNEVLVENGLQTIEKQFNISALLNVDNIDRVLIFEKYLNAIVTQYDFHSKYYSARSRDEYNKLTTGKIVGIGVSLGSKDKFMQISGTTPGGPAWKSKKIEIGDIVLKVAQGNDDPVDIVGLSLYDGSKLIRGTKGTIVKLTIKKYDGKIVVIPIKRDVVESDDVYIKSCIVEKNNLKYGLISFPSFYADFDDEKERNSFNDFETELEVLKKSDVNGVIVDMRNNSGGAVEEATKIMGLFIKKGVVVQVKSKNEKLDVLEDTDNQISWEKGVVLLVNSETASSAEFFAAAMQDFRRGIIIGDSKTFGKGTMQETLDLNTYNLNKDDKDDFGTLKTTIKQIYRPNGISTQILGVVPDVILNDLINIRKRILERELQKVQFEDKNPHIIVSDQIKKIDNKPFYEELSIINIVKNSKQRVLENPIFRFVKEEKQDNNNFINTNLNKLKARIIEKQNNINKENLEMPQKTNFSASSNIADYKNLRKNEYLQTKRKQWQESLLSDFLIEESVNILFEMKDLVPVK